MTSSRLEHNGNVLHFSKLKIQKWTITLNVITNLYKVFTRCDNVYTIRWLFIQNFSVVAAECPLFYNTMLQNPSRLYWLESVFPAPWIISFWITYLLFSLREHFENTWCIIHLGGGICADNAVINCLSWHS